MMIQSGLTRARLPLAGALLALVFSVGLAFAVVIRDVAFNPLNLWTIVGGALGGAIVVASPGHARLAAVIVAVAAAPALIGGLGLLYAPSVILLASRRRLIPNRSRKSSDQRHTPEGSSSMPPLNSGSPDRPAADTYE